MAVQLKLTVAEFHHEPLFTFGVISSGAFASTITLLVAEVAVFDVAFVGSQQVTFHRCVPSAIFVIALFIKVSFVTSKGKLPAAPVLFMTPSRVRLQ